MGIFKKKIRRVLFGGLSLTLCVSLSTSTIMLTSADSSKSAGNSSANSQSVGFENVTGQYDASKIREQNFSNGVLSGSENYQSATRTVIVGLEGENILDYTNGRSSVPEYLATAEGRHALRNIESEQRTFLNNLNSNGISYYLKSTYAAINNAVAIEVNYSDVAAIRKMNGVKSVVYSQTYLAPQTVETTGDSRTNTNDIVNDANVYNTGIYDSSAVEQYTEWGTGNGTVVAILDTGLDYTHKAFNRVGENLKFTNNYIKSKITETEAYQRALENGYTLSADDVYVNDKVAFAFDYADNDADVYPSYSNHGTHVAGIVAGYDETGYDKDNVHYDETFKGVAPDAQLMICKVFTDDLDSESIGGAESENIMSALEDCVTLGVDVINMSLGTTAGFTLTAEESDAEGQFLFSVFDSIRAAGISLICAASNDYSAGYGSAFGTNLTSNPDSGTVGSPSTYYAALSVASISGQKSKYFLSSNDDAIFYDESSDGNSVQYNFQELIFDKLNITESSAQIEYVVVGGVGAAQNYNGIRNLFVDNSGKKLNRIALVKRGDINFQEKVEIASAMGAVGIIVYNNVSGKIRMSLGDVAEDNFIPAISITLEAGNALVKAARSNVGTLSFDSSLEAGPFMSEFSSWGVTNDLILKPEITAHGGEITSTVPGGYAEQSGTSMASPNMAGVTALVRNYVKNVLGITDTQAITRRTNQLIMSTASTVKDETGLAYSPRKQGSGLANLKNIVSTQAYLYTDQETDGDRYYEGKDYRPKVELGDDKNKKGEYSFSFKVANFGDTNLQFKPQALFMTESLSADGIAVAEKAYMLKDTGTFTVKNGSYDGNILTVNANSEATVSVTLKLTSEEWNYINDSFENGMFVEGFVQLVSTTDGEEGGQCTLNLPFVGFFGDWEDMPLLDYDAFEIADFEQDASIQDELKPKAAIFATQPYAKYAKSNYIIPMGSYLYAQDENADKMYANRDHCSISRFDEYVSDDGVGNYLTAYSIRCVYAGLLRNAKRVDYKLYDAYSGELVTSDSIYRVGKAYANSGSAAPAFVEFNLEPEKMGLQNNGKYTMDFEFYFTGNEVIKEENVFSFDFYVDYEAPVLQDARVRYYTYKDANNREKQRIYIDLDIYDNHYAQSVMLCYYDPNKEVPTMNLATEYITPVRNAVKNGVTTVSIEVTDIWDQYKDVLALQIDDYALNHSMYVLSQLNGTVGNVTDNLNSNVTPATFELAEGEEKITIGLNETHKVSLVYDGSADLANFSWTSVSPYVSVQNGEIFGKQVTRANSPARVTVSNRKGVNRTIEVTVVDTGTKPVSIPSLSFGAIENSGGALVKASNTVKVNAGEDINLNLITEPWYFDQSKVEIEWSSNKPQFAKVEGVVENGRHIGKVHTVAEGNAIITARIKGTQYSATVTLSVQDPFTISNLSLTHYHGDGITDESGQEGVVIIPDGKNIMTIGEEAFKDNTKITKVIIPKTVTQISERAFIGCTNLKEIYFVSEDKVGSELKSNLTLIQKRAFYGLPSLKKVDLTNVKVITVAAEVFADCTALEEVVNTPAIGTAHSRAFMGCSSLESYDLSGLHVSGDSVFSGCTSLKTITTAEYTSLGYGMFAALDYVYQEYGRLPNGTYGYLIKTRHYPACVSLGSEGAIDINVPAVGESAFEGCESLKQVNFNNIPEITVGVNAFNGCKNLSGFNLTGSSTIKSIGTGAFNGTLVPNFGNANGELIIDGVLVKYSGVAENYTVPAGVTKIGAYAFADSNIKSVDFSEAQITEIGAYAFEGTGITSVRIPSTVTVLGEGVFLGCSSLTNVTFEEGSSLKVIPANAFRGAGITSISLPSTVIEIENYAFAQSALVNFAYAPQSEASFGSFIFYGCSGLVNIVLADNITKMGDYVFADCVKLESVTLPSLNELGIYTFARDNALKTVTFGANAKTTGSYTFVSIIENQNGYYLEGLLSLTGVTLGSPVEIGEAAFYGCNLTQIDLKNAKIIGDYAFFGSAKLQTVTGIDKVTAFGNYSFANCAKLGNFSIASAQTIGDYAFASANTANKITLPGSLKSIGGGAFSNNTTLAEYSVSENNEVFFAVDGVLYKKVSDGEYILVSYPTAKSVAAATEEKHDLNGKKVYRVIDGTVSIGSGAFCDIAENNIEAVILPYTLLSIGDRAFYNTDIYEYCFESIAAPILQSEYNAEIDEICDLLSVNLRAHYLANFVDEIFLHSSSAKGFDPEKPVAKLTMYRPENGTGYANYVYSTYFDTVVSIGVMAENSTREIIDIIDNFPSVSEISSWNTTNKTKEEIIEFSDLVMQARNIYSNTMDSDQLAMIGEERVKKLSDTESALRAVKEIFGINPKPVRLKYSTDSTFKSQYKSGETLDWTGLTVTVEYDDGSTAVVPREDLTLVNEEFTVYDSFAELTAYGLTLNVRITVTAADDNNPQPPIKDEDEKGGCGGCNGAVGIAGTITAMTVAAITAVVLTTVIRKKSRKTNE